MIKAAQEELYAQDYKSPLGPLYLVAKGDRLVCLTFKSLWPKIARRFKGEPSHEAGNAVLSAATRQLDEYFAGTRQLFDLPLELAGTDFEKRVWAYLGSIPYGERRSYKQQATAIGAPTAMRAVGAANGRNPLCIVLPCHRVVNHSGGLSGYAGGLEAKTYLLKLEEPREV